MRSVGLLLVAVAGLAVAGCVAAGEDEPAVSRTASAIGEPMNGFPSAAERLGIMAINRARSDPATVSGPQSATYPPRPPVLWSYELSRSARFHATSLRLSNVTLMHTSPCPLNTDVATTGCTGDPACACATAVPAMCAACASVAATNSCGTDPFVRIAYFTAGTTTSASGEVAAAGYSDPMAVVDGWMDEAAGSDGHRKNLTDQGIKSNTMGYGHSEGTACYSSFDVSDSGSVTGAQLPKIPTAAVRGPARGAAGSYTFYATWADPALGAPSSLNVVVDGACTAMAREIGSDTLNATYKATATLAAGCHNYFVVASDGAGARVAYPTTGAITISVAGMACNSDYLTPAPAASCAGDGGTQTVDASTDAVATGTGGRSGAGGSGAGGKSGTGGAGTGGVGAGGVGAGAGGKAGTGGAAVAGTGGAIAIDAGRGGSPDTGAISGGCSCAVAASGAASSAWGLILLAGLALSRRRRTAR